MILAFLVVLNLRGVKESVNLLTPIFVAFVVMHVLVIGYVFLHDFHASARGLPRRASRLPRFARAHSGGFLCYC